MRGGGGGRGGLKSARGLGKEGGGLKSAPGPKAQRGVSLTWTVGVQP